MSEYKPGTVAEIGWPMTSGVERALFDGKFWNTESGISVNVTTSVRPLLVLDLDRFVTPELLATWLRQNQVCGSYSVAGEIADQIEAQTKPPRIPEPGLWGVVEARVPGLPTRRWVHHEEGRWVPDTGIPFQEWDDLIDPVLIREGVES